MRRPSLGLVFLIQTCLQLFGLYLFLKGFLLTRQTMDLHGHFYSSWDRFPLHHVPSIPPPFPVTKPKPSFKRTVIILIDALRFDFVLNISEPSNPYFLNQFPLLHQLYETQPQSSLLYQFRADPPTTTMQRVKGIMTGSLPTFIDAGANFASSAVNEDHLLHHIKTKFEQMYLMGDDTWVNLFPEVFNDPLRTFESDSFKMLDLDSVDNAILSHLWPVMEGPWEVAIAHFLGVDHCGHTFGPSDPNMKRKLNQMNTMIERLLQYIDEETLLVVMGDHGMSVEGDHGGESIEELMSTLFLHSKRPLTLHGDYYKDFFSRIHQERGKKLGYDIDSISDRLSYNASRYPVVSQIHLVPTLAYLLQVPIPFGNLGAIIPDIIYSENDKNQVSNLLHMVEQFRKNALQVYDYLQQYSQQTHQLDFSQDKTSALTQHLFNAEEIMLQLSKQPKFLNALTNTVEEIDSDLVNQLENAILEYDAFLISMIKYCEAIWAQFDTGCMFIGIVLLLSSTLFSLWLMKRNIYTGYKSALIVAVSAFCMSLFAVYLRYTTLAITFLSKGWFEKMEHLDWLGVSVTLTLCCITLFTKQRRVSVEASPYWYAYDWHILLAGNLAQSFTLGSNSYVIWEDRGTRFALATLSMLWIARNLQSLTTYTRESILKSILYPLSFMVFVRISSVTGQCREEQFPHCAYTYGSLGFGNHVTGYFTLAFILTAISLICCFSRRTFIKNRWIASMYQVSGLIIVFKMVQEIYQKNAMITQDPWVQKFSDVYLPRVVYGLCLLGTMISMCQWVYSRNKLTGWPILLLWSTVLAIVQRPFASVILLASPFCIQLLTTGAQSSLLFRLSLLHFLGHHLFFVTGHQATFTSLPWKAAFVGFDEMNYYGGMILVTLSTMAGYIVSWIGWFLVTEDGYTLNLLTMLQSIPTCLSAVLILVLRRHLMTWKIFAPRFLLQVLVQVGAHVAAIVLEKAL